MGTAENPDFSHKTVCFCLVFCSVLKKDFGLGFTVFDFPNSVFTSHRSSRFMACSAISHNLWKLHVPQFPITLVFRIFSSSFRGLIASKWKGVVCRPQKPPRAISSTFPAIWFRNIGFGFGTGFAVCSSDFCVRFALF